MSVSRASLERVSLSFGPGREVLADVSLALAPGELVCLVGPSGSGKSTILDLFAGLRAPSCGQVRFDGEAVRGPSPARGVVFQDAALFPWLTLRDNVAFALSVQGVRPRERDARALALLERVELADFAARYPHELSGGMRQRGALARALATSPSMLLFDEPFAALDAKLRATMQREVERVVTREGMTALFVTHQIDEAVRLGDRVVVLGGRPSRVVADVPVDVPRPERAQGSARARELVRELERLVLDAEPSEHDLEEEDARTRRPSSSPEAALLRLERRGAPRAPRALGAVGGAGR